ncbi:MAG: hypothetical protein JKY71_01405 [Alphaproteobacteria bacterium]|nr:hypothetical protein [Alphaproteobacteria bacterium]
MDREPEYRRGRESHTKTILIIVALVVGAFAASPSTLSYFNGLKDKVSEYAKDLPIEAHNDYASARDAAEQRKRQVERAMYEAEYGRQPPSHTTAVSDAADLIVSGYLTRKDPMPSPAGEKYYLHPYQIYKNNLASIDSVPIPVVLDSKSADCKKYKEVGSISAHEIFVLREEFGGAVLIDYCTALPRHELESLMVSRNLISSAGEWIKSQCLERGGEIVESDDQRSFRCDR